jgi:hypothetical protein
VVVPAAQIVVVPGIVAFAMKLATENREKMKPQVVGINGSWNHQRNGSAHVLDIADSGSGRVVDVEIVQRVNTPRRGNYQVSSNGMEVKAPRRMVKRWEDDQKAAVEVTDQD